MHATINERKTNTQPLNHTNAARRILQPTPIKGDTMKFSVSQTSFNQALSIVCRGLSSQNTMAILAGVYIHASEGTLTLQTTDLKVSIKHAISAAVEEEGSVVVSGALLLKIVKNLPDAAITLTSTDTQAQLTCQKASFTLATLNPEDFPEFPVLNPNQVVELPTSLLTSMVDKVFRVTKDDIANPILSGITLVAHENKLSMYATDSHRLVIIDTSTETSSLTEEFNAIIPATAFHELLSLPSLTDTITLGLCDNQIVFSCENTTFVTLKIEGMFPNFKNLFPTTCATKLTCSPTELSAVIRRVALVTTNSDLGVVFDINPQTQTLTLKADSVEYGTSQEEFAVHIEGAPVQFSMNYQFITECTKSCTNKDEITFEIVDNMQPIVVKSFGTINYQCLLIPLRTN